MHVFLKYNHCLNFDGASEEKTINFSFRGDCFSQKIYVTITLNFSNFSIKNVRQWPTFFAADKTISLFKQCNETKIIRENIFINYV